MQTKITMQDTIKKAISIRGLAVLQEKKRFLILLEDLAPALTEEREFLEKVYQNELGKIFCRACLADKEKRAEYLTEADVFLEEQYGLNRAWRERALSYFRDLQLHRVLFRVLSKGEEKRNMEVFVPRVLTGDQVSVHLSSGPLLKLLYSEQRQCLGVRNISSYIWTVIGPDGAEWECSPGTVQPLEEGMMIRIIPRTAQMNVLECI